MLKIRSIVLIAITGVGWTFSPYLALLNAPTSQSEFSAQDKMGLFENDDGVNILVSIDADKDLRAFDVQAKITEKSIPFSWRLSPPDGDVFQIANRNGVVTGSYTYLGGSAIDVSSKSRAFRSKFLRDERPPYQQHLVEFENDGVELAATVFAAVENAHGIGVVMIHGSGKSDRNNLWYIAQADYLARQGFTVLLPDKRGSGRSGGLWKTATMTDLAADANAAVEALSNMEGLSISRIGLMGLSQGGHIAPVAATANSNVAFVVNVVGSLTTFDEALTHESENLFRGHMPEILKPPLIFIANQVARARIPLWWIKNGSFSSKPYWTDLNVPALIIWGEEDEFENVSVKRSSELLEEINNNRSEPIDLKIYPGLGHALFDETGWFSEDYLSLLSVWMREAGKSDFDQSVQGGENHQ